MPTLQHGNGYKPIIRWRIDEQPDRGTRVLYYYSRVWTDTEKEVIANALSHEDYTVRPCGSLDEQNRLIGVPDYDLPSHPTIDNGPNYKPRNKKKE